MNIKNLVVGGAMAISALVAASAASATTYMYTVSDDSQGTILTGDFTTTTATGEVTSLSGFLLAAAFAQAGPVTLVANPNFPAATNNGIFIYDNLYDGTTGANILTGFNNNGLLFLVGGQEYNLFSNGANPYILYNQSGQNENVMFSASVVPEPATWAMMILGIGLLGAGLRLGSKKPEPALA